MDQLNSAVEVPRALSLDGLCSGAHHELLIRGYSRRMLNRYMRVWKHLAEFAREHNLGNTYSRSLAMRFEEVRLTRPTGVWTAEHLHGRGALLVVTRENNVREQPELLLLDVCR